MSEPLSKPLPTPIPSLASPALCPDEQLLHDWAQVGLDRLERRLVHETLLDAHDATR